MRQWIRMVETMLGEASKNAGDETVFTVPVKALATMYDPFENSPWFGTNEKISPAEVARAIKNEELESNFHQPNIEQPASEEYHIRRIAHLVVHPDPEPIIVYRNPRMGAIDLDDGFHRLAAAIYRGDSTIKVAFNGTKKQLNQWLGVGS